MGVGSVKSEIRVECPQDPVEFENRLQRLEVAPLLRLLALSQPVSLFIYLYVLCGRNYYNEE